MTYCNFSGFAYKFVILYKLFFFFKFPSLREVWVVGNRDSSVGLVTRQRVGWSGDRIPVGGGRDFKHPSRPALGLTQPPIQWVPGLSRGVKRPGRSVDHPPPSSAEVEGRVELYICSPFWAC